MSSQYDFGFASSVAMFDDFLVRAHKKHGAELHSELAYEASERLRQMQFLLDRIAAINAHTQSGKPLSSDDLQLKLEPPTATPGEDNGKHIREAMFVVRAHTESFYYLAFRFWKILKMKPIKAGGRGIPLLGSFECPGVRDVRNHLLEHPDGPDSQIFTQTFDLGTHEGPRLKVHTDFGPPPKHNDAGLFVNAAEFKANLQKLLTRVIAEQLQ